MPKLKTHRGAAKRIKVTGTGKFMRKKEAHSHLLEKKSAKRKRNLKKYTVIGKEFRKSIARLLPYK